MKSKESDTSSSNSTLIHSVYLNFRQVVRNHRSHSNKVMKKGEMKVIKYQFLHRTIPKGN